MVLGQRGGVGRAEGTEKWSAEGRNAILVTRTGWERAEKGPEGRRGTGRCLERQNQQLEPGAGAGARCWSALCSDKTLVFKPK